MKTVIRNSYTPKIGDYCNKIVVDKETNTIYFFDVDGVFTEVDNTRVDVDAIIAEAVAEAGAYTDEVAETKVDKEEGKGLSSNDFTDAEKEKLESVEADAQENVIEEVKVNGSPLTVTNKSVDVSVPTTTSGLTNDSGFITNAVDDLVNYYDKDDVDGAISTETENREAADNNLQQQIDTISASSDVVDIVGTYTDLQNYDTTKLHDNDIIKVLDDSTHNDATAYYRWDTDTSAFSYIGSEGPYYTKSEADSEFVPQTRTVNGKALSANITLDAADVGALPSSTVIPTVNDATLTIQKNGTDVATFTANSNTNTTANLAIPTAVSDLTNDLDFVESSDLSSVAFSGAYSDLSGKPSIPTKTSDLTNDSDFVSDANYVHTDNNFTTAEKTKLSGIAAGAEVNVQSDWSQTDNTADDYIKNKPAIPTKTSDLTNDSGFITSAALPTKTSDLTNDSGFITNTVDNLTNYYDQTTINNMFNAIPSIPTKTSDLTNDSGFLTTSTLPIATTSSLGVVKIGSGLSIDANGVLSSSALQSVDWSDITNKPTNVSYWTNDAGYITSAALPTKTSDLTNDSGFITSASLPTKTSDLTNDSGFITDATNSLTNYYKKSETYTQGEVNSLLSAIVIPTVNDATLTIQKNGTTIDTFTANSATNTTVNIGVPTKTSDLTNDSNFVSTTDYASANTAGVIKVGGGLAMTNGVLSATGGGTADAVEWTNVLNRPSDVSYWTNDAGYITSAALPTKTSDLTNDGSDGTSTYVEADDLATVATSGSYNDLTNKPTIPTVNDATLTIQKNSTSVGTFTANASSNKTINITVPTTAADVSALPDSTKYAASLTASINTTTYVMTLTLKDQDGNTLGTAQTIDLPLESVVVNGSYDSTNKKIVLTLQSGSTIDIPVGDLISGLQSEITSNNKLASDLVDDTNQTHKFMTSAEKTKLSGIAAGAEVNVQSDWTQTTTTADDYIKNKPTLATVATSGSYNDLSNKPTIGNATLTVKHNNVSQGTFTANATTNSTVDIKAPQRVDLSSTAQTNSYRRTVIGLCEVSTTNNTEKDSFSSGRIVMHRNNGLAGAVEINIQIENQYSNAYYTNVAWYANLKLLSASANINTAKGFRPCTFKYNNVWYGGIEVFVDNAQLGHVVFEGDTNFAVFALDYYQVPHEQTASAILNQEVYDSLDYTQWTLNKGKEFFNNIDLYTGSMTKNDTYTYTFPDKNGTVAMTSDIPSVPTVNNGQLTIQKNGSNVATFTANQSGNSTANITVPTKTSDLTNDSDFATKLYVQSRGENLVTNGSGLLENNYNFGNFTFDPLVANGTPGSFRLNTLNAIVKNDELIPVDITQDYKFSFDIRTTNGSARFYDTIFSYDVDGNQIMYYNVNWIPGTTTTLSQKLSPGDTVVHLTSLAGWNITTTYSYQKGFIFWNYVNSLGYAWGTETYSRNRYNNLYTDNAAVDKTANTITLSSAWAGPEIPAGTSVSQCTDGGNYIYVGTQNYTVTADTWVHRESILTKDLYRTGTAFVGVGWLANRNITGTISTWFNNVQFAMYTAPVIVDSALSSTSENPVQNKVINTALSGKQASLSTAQLDAANSGITATKVASYDAYASQIAEKADLSALDDKQDTLTPGDHIDITNDVISAVDYVHSENPVSVTSATPTVTGSMIANGTITADKLATGATIQLTLSTTDIGEGAALAANTLYGVYQ